MQTSKIEWTDSTFNPWIGCQKVSAGCDNCYAQPIVTRIRRGDSDVWGPGSRRKRTSPQTWSQPLKWNSAASRRPSLFQDQADVRPHRVFCASLADVFDNRAPRGARSDLWRLIAATPNLTWQILTKRPQNFTRFLPADWGLGYRDVWLGISAENQHTYDRRWPHLAAVGAAVKFVSFEPMLGPVTLQGHSAKPDWVIWGGESGPGARTANPQWARDITSECVDGNVAVFGKQWGIYQSNPLLRKHSLADVMRMDPPSNGKGGALLDGMLWRQFPRQINCRRVIAA